MKTLRHLPWLVVAGLTAGSISSQCAEQPNPAADVGQDSEAPQQQIEPARPAPPIYLFDLYGKTPALSRVRRAGIQEETSWPRFRRQPGDQPTASASESSARTVPRIQEFRSPSGSYAGIAWAPAYRPGRAGDVRPEVALIVPRSQTGEAPVPTPTGKVSGREAPPRAEDQPAVEHPRVSELNDPEAEAVQPRATVVDEPFVPAPTGKTSGRPVPAVGSREQALLELLRLYLNDEITPGEYHRRRAEIVGEP